MSFERAGEKFFERVRELASRIKPHRKLIVSMGLLFLIIAVSAALRFNMIANSMPYPGKWDEGNIVLPAVKILKEGDFHPSHFMYPTFPIYVTAIGFTLGYISAVTNLELKNTKRIGSVFYPYFDHPRIVWTARAMFALFSVLTFLFLGLLVYRVFENYLAMVLTPLILSLSSTYFYYSYHYINVDILGVFFVSALYLYLFYHLEKDTYLHRSVLPGILCGAVIASKYTLFLIVLPCILVILFYSHRQRLFKALSIIPVMGLTFLLLNPFVLIDFSRFLDTIAISISDYAGGKYFLETQPGVDLFVLFVNRILTDFGYGTAVFALLGLGVSFKNNWKKFLILIAFPVGHMIYMSNQKAYAVRNVMAAYAFHAVFVALGIAVFYDLLDKMLKKVPILNKDNESKISD